MIIKFFILLFSYNLSNIYTVKGNFLLHLRKLMEKLKNNVSSVPTITNFHLKDTTSFLLLVKKLLIEST